MKYILTFVLCVLSLFVSAADYSISTNKNNSIGTIEIPAVSQSVAINATNKITNTVPVTSTSYVTNVSYTYTTNYIIVGGETNSPPPTTNPPALNAWYVSSTVSTSGDGKSWNSAWKNTSNIIWSNIKPGHTIYLDGGNDGLSYASFGEISVSGSQTELITIARSLEPGRNGPVLINSPWRITGNYIKIDGGQWHGITFNCNAVSYTSVVPSGAAVVNSGQNNTFINCYFYGNYSAGWGHSFGHSASSGTMTLIKCHFFQSVYEDQWVANGSGGSLAFTNCVFNDNNKINRTDTAHRDVANPWTGGGGWNLYVVGCIFYNTPGRVSGFQGDELLLQVSSRLGRIVLINNVCFNTARFLAFGSGNGGAESVTAYNNTWYNVTGTIQNGVSTPLIQGNNINGNPGFINPNNPLGPDEIPFTSDDGFRLNSGSSAIDAGSNVGVSLDITGKVRVNPDLGAYEF